MKDHPKNLSVEEILVRSSNVGSVMLTKKIGQENFKEFIKKQKLQKIQILNLKKLGLLIK